MTRHARNPHKIISTPSKDRYTMDSLRLAKWMIEEHGTNLNVFLHMATRIGWDTIIGHDEMAQLYHVEDMVKVTKEYYINYDALMKSCKDDPIELVARVYYTCPEMFMRYQLYKLLTPVAHLVTPGDVIRGMVKFFSPGMSINPETHAVFSNKYSTQTLYGNHIH